MKGPRRAGGSAWVGLVVGLLHGGPAAGQPNGEPPPESQGGAEPSGAAPADGAAAAGGEPLEVTVEGDKPTRSERRAAERTFQRREIERVPGAFGDPFRVLEVLPGVVPMASGLPHFAVRGALPSSAGYYLDGIRVPFLFHLGIGPSVVNPAMIEAMDFHPGPYPARFGRHVGGVVTARSVPPPATWRAEATLRVFDAGGFVEAPLPGGWATAFVGGRYSYTAQALSLFAPDTSLSYWDYQAGGSLQLSDQDRLRLLAFGSSDYLGEVAADDTETELFAAEFHRIHLRHEHVPRRRAIDGKPSRHDPSSRAGLTFAYDRTGLGSEGAMAVHGIALSGDGELPLGRPLRLRLGGSMNLDVHDFQRSASEPEPEAGASTDPDGDEFEFDIGDTFAIERTAAMGGYLELAVQPMAELEIVPGLRSDVFTEDGFARAGVDPRGRIRTRPLPWLTTVSAIGLAHQRPALLVAVPGLDPQALSGGLQEVVQLSQGVGVSLAGEVELGWTGFYHHYSQLTDLTATCTVGVRQCAVGDRADGRAYGLEVTVRRSLAERIGGMISYTLSRAERTARGETTLADFDRTHIVHLVIGVDLGRHWHAGARLTAYSGRPYSLVSFDDPDDPARPTLVGRRNALRRDPFHRLDLRIEKRWHIGATGWISLVLEGMNVTLQKEVVDFDCRIAEVVGTDTGLSCGGQEIGPIAIPSIGVSGGF